MHVADVIFFCFSGNMCHFDLLSDFYERCYNIVLMVLPQNTCPDQPPELEETEGIQHHKKIIKKIEALKNPPL